ncbi:hypothetical protein E2K98_12675 [Bacillus salipaludis]|uniref:Uncharacterized protein n=1 Tax=Bacillus salipaludis TaxID=2547811 RepID=A0A4R5VT16_9BACI|nr:hypothetical protein [Bacillus salipaludis]TDK61737.1 hypothetical protein E2K98_12675 [Bacillus salipaludis]
MRQDKELLEFDLLENGLDFILSAINNLSNEGKAELKYGILHLSAGVDLILKYRLSKEHWTLLFSKIDAASKEKLKSGDFTSVDSSGCIDRLKKICGIDFETEDLNQLKHLRERRNRLEHFGITESAAALKSTTLKVLNFILDFINDQIDYSKLNVSEKNQLDSIRQQLPELEEFVEERLELIEDEIESYKKLTAVTICLTCYQTALVIDEGTKCLFCGAHGEGEKVAEEFVFKILGISQYDTKDGEEYPVYECFECGAESMVHSNQEYDSFDWLCFTCGTKWDEDEIEYCETCGGPYMTSKHDIGMCSNCIEHQMNQ